MNDLQEDSYQCIGYCQVDEAGYCLGCGRPLLATVNTCSRTDGDTPCESSAGDCLSAASRFPIDPLSQ